MTAQSVEKKQPRRIRYSDSELSVIKNTFADNHEELTRVIRKIFLQLPMDVLDKGTLDLIKGNRAVLSILRKTFLPTIDVDAPLHQVVDLWMTVDIKEKSLEYCELILDAREQLIDYLEQQLIWLESKEELPAEIAFDRLTKIRRATKADKVKTVANFIMRNTLLGHIEQQLTQLFNLAGTKDETPEQTLKRLAQDSSK